MADMVVSTENWSQTALILFLPMSIRLAGGGFEREEKNFAGVVCVWVGKRERATLIGFFFSFLFFLFFFFFFVLFYFF